jgi:hypothetical protein
MEAWAGQSGMVGVSDGVQPLVLREIRTCRAVLMKGWGPETAHSCPFLTTVAETRLDFHDTVDTTQRREN